MTGLVRMALAAAILVPAVSAQAHFQVIQPAPAVVTGESGPDVALDLVFTHPMAGGPVMTMAPPVRAGVMRDGAIVDLTGDLEAGTQDGATVYRLDHTVTTPADHVFFIEPAPYWEPAEGKSIIHYAKVVVPAFGAFTGWDQPVGLPVEIMPLTRPYGLYAGNVFQGRVLQDGAPVPGAEIEVEYLNPGDVTPPSEAHETQVIRADDRGVFTYALPRAGWWGFAALIDGPTPLPDPEGQPAPVELGAVLWVHADPMGGD